MLRALSIMRCIIPGLMSHSFAGQLYTIWHLDSTYFEPAFAGCGAGVPTRQPIGVRAASLDSSLEEGGSGAGAPKPQPVGVGTASLRPPIIGFHANQTKTARPRKQMPNEFNRPASVGPAPKKAPTANARMAIVTINLCATSNLPIRHSLDSWVPEGPWSAC